MTVPGQQHFLRADATPGLLDGLDLAARDVVEFGAGTGALTRLLLEAGARSVEAWELDPALANPFPGDARLDWRTADIRAAAPGDVAGRAVAAFPPYDLLPFLLRLCRASSDLLLMAPGRMAGECAAMGLRVLRDLDGGSFEPPSSGRHLVVARGFSRLS